MGIKYNVVKDGHLVIEKFSGRLSFEELLRHIDHLSTKEGIQNGAINVADFRGLQIPDFDVDDVVQLVEARSANVKRNRISKLAILVDEVDGFDLVTRYETLMKQAGVNVLVSSSMATVCRFMNLDQVTVEAELLRI